MQAIRVKKLYDGSMERPMENAIVVFEGQYIKDVVKQGDEVKLGWYNLAVPECSGLYMIPGLIDGHVHLMCPGDGRIDDEVDAIPTGQRQLMAMTNAQTAMREGVTTLCDCGCDSDIAYNVREYINKGEVTGPDVLICGGALMATAGHGVHEQNIANGVVGVKRRIRQLLLKDIDFVKVMGTTRSGRSFDRACFGYTEEEFRAIYEEAHRVKLPATVHATYTDVIRHMVDCGADCIEHCNFFDSRWSRVIKDKALAEYINEKGVIADHTIGVNFGRVEMLEQKDKSLWTEEEKRAYPGEKALCEMILESFSFQMEQGIKAIAGTDSGFLYCNFKTGMKLSLENMASAGMSNLETIHSATGRSAAFFGVDDRLGMIRPGMQADMVLLSSDPGEDMKALRNVVQVYKKGVPVR